MIEILKMDKKIKVSIIVTVYNGEKFLAQALNSLFVQTLTDIEVIAVNDASTDGSGKILDRISENESRLTVIHLDKNKGNHEARSEGLRASQGPWVGFLDADDVAKPDMFNQLYNACIDDQVDIAICGVDKVSVIGEKIESKVFFNEGQIITNNIFERFCRLEFGPGYLPNKLYKKTLISKFALLPFCWRVNLGQDTVVNIGCFMQAKRIRLVRGQLYNYTVHPASVTQFSTKIDMFCGIIRAYAVAIELYGQTGRRCLNHITELYSRQLDYDAYRVENLDELQTQEAPLTEAIRLLAKENPIALAALLSRRKHVLPPHQSAALPAIKLWINLSAKIPGLCLKAIWRRATKATVAFLGTNLK